MGKGKQKQSYGVRPIPLTPFPGWKGGTDERISELFSAVVTPFRVERERDEKIHERVSTAEPWRGVLVNSSSRHSQDAARARVILKRGREGPVRGGNPWIFSQAIDRIEPPSPEAGALVTVHDASGAMLGMGYCNLATTIAIRMIAWGEAPAIEELVARRLKGALEIRRRFIRDDTNSYRLVNGDGDGLSGVVVDRFGDVLVVQILTAGADGMHATIVAALNDLLHPRSIIERSHGAVRKQEGLEDHIAVLSGEPVTETIAAENGIKLKIDFEHGQKTGYFLDQRDNRAMAGRMASGARVLDAFCYQAGFSLAAIAGGASKVVAVDTSARALEVARQNLRAERVSCERRRVRSWRSRQVHG